MITIPILTTLINMIPTNMIPSNKIPTRMIPMRLIPTNLMTMALCVSMVRIPSILTGRNLKIANSLW
jgi:hypothetical protein